MQQRLSALPPSPLFPARCCLAREISRASLVALLLFLLGLLLAQPSSAEEAGTLRDRLQLSGFGTLGVVYDPSTSHLQRDWQPDTFHNDFSFLTDSLLGAQLDLHVADRLDATVQMVVKSRAEQSLDESLEWAFLRWRPLQDLTVRAGRLGLDVYLLSDYRNVGFAYLWQRPVVEFYGPLLIYNLNGGDVSYSFNAGEGRITAKIFGGVSWHSLQLARNEEPNSISVAPVLGGRLSYEDEELRLCIGYANATLGENMRDVGLLANALRGVPQAVWPDAAAIADAVANEDKRMSFYSLGATYETKDWIIQGEAGYLSTDWVGAPDVLSGYVSAGRHLGSVTPYLVLAAAKSIGGPPAFSGPAATGDAAVDARLSALNAAAQLFFRKVGIEQKTLSLGARWDFHPNAALKFQWDLSHVGANGSALWWQPDSAPLANSTYINMLSTSINFAF